MNKFRQLIGIISIVALLLGVVSSVLVTFDDHHVSRIHYALSALLFLIFCFAGGLRDISSGFGKRIGRFGVATILYSTLFFVFLFAINFAASKREIFHVDTTEQDAYTLAPQTKALIDTLPSTLSIKAFYAGSVMPPETKALLNRLARYSENISWEAIDPDKDPTITEKLGINEDKTVHLSLGEGVERRESKIVRSVSEEKIAKAILKISKKAPEKIYYLMGHGEGDFEDRAEGGYLFLKESLEGENISVSRLVFSQVSEVPSDAKALIVIAPKRSFFAEERATLRRYLSKGGKAVFLHDVRGSEDIKDIVEPLGILVGKDVVVDTMAKFLDSPDMGVQPVISTFDKGHEITRKFNQSVRMSTVSSVQAAENPPEGADVTELAFSTAAGWAETNLELLFGDDPQATKEESDVLGPVSVAAAYRQSVSNEEGDEVESRVVVIGDADFVSNINIRQAYNRDFFLNSVGWVLGESTSLEIRPGTLRESTKRLTEEQVESILLLTVIIIPEILIVVGFSFWWVRRSRESMGQEKGFEKKEDKKS